MTPGARRWPAALALSLLTCARPSSSEPSRAGETGASAERATPEAHKEVSRNTCLRGMVKTAGEMTIPVARAKVTVLRNGSVAARLVTAEDGSFEWCVAESRTGEAVKATVRVDKPPFKRGEKTHAWAPGSTAQIDVLLDAEELTR